MLPFFHQTTDNTISSTRNLLRLLKVRVTETTLKDTLRSHPDYPSLLSVADALKSWHVDTLAINSDAEKLVELPCPFIAHLKERGGRFILVKAVEDKEIIYMDEQGQETVLPKETFLEQWDGVVLLAEADANSGDPDYQKALRKELWDKAKIPAAAGVVILLGVWQIVSHVIHPAAGSVYFSLLLGCKMLGMTVAGLLLWYEYDRNNPFLQQVCSFGKKTNCHAVLSSSASKVTGSITWSDVGFIYFTGGYLYLLIAGSAALLVLMGLNLIALPYILFSVYYQARVARQWCVFCLTVQAILLLEFVSVLATGEYSVFYHSFNIQNSALIIFFLSFLLPAIAWLFTKPYLYDAKEGRQLRYQLAHFKNNEEVFHALLRRQPAMQKGAEGLGIIIGNPEAKHTLVKVCNPYCGPCAKAHPKIEELIRDNENWKAQIIFTATGEEGDMRTAPTAHLMAVAEKQVKADIEQALDDWYNAKEKNYEAFAAIYPMNGELKMQKEKLQAMDRWCRNVGITYTPTFFVDGYGIPKQYSVEDLKYL